MSPEEILAKMKAEFEKDSSISKSTLQELKKILEQLKNAQQGNSQKTHEVLLFKEKMIGQCVAIFDQSKTDQQTKILLLELLERELISSKYNPHLFNKLYNFLVHDDENVATQASKAIDSLIKQINEKSQVTPGAQPLDLKQHYIKLFQFLKERTEFLLKLKEKMQDNDFKVFKRQQYDENRDREKQRDKKQAVFKNSKSLKFINQVPHLFIHLMAYAELDTKVADEDKQIKQLIKDSIENIIQSLRKTPYTEFYNEYNFEFNNELFGVMTKLLQFLFITLRNEKDDRSREGNKSNMNLRKHINEQLEFIKVPEVIKNFIHLLKNCSEDFQLNRYEIVNRLKLLLCSLDKNKLNRAEAIDILGELLTEETVYGRKKLLGDYSKNAICSYWIEIIKSSVLLENVFYPGYLNIRVVSSNSIPEDSKEITECFLNIEKLLEEVLKTIFDNTIYPSVQEKCIELLNNIVERLFPETGGDHGFDPSALNNSNIAKKVHESKLKILQKILQAASLKFESIKNIFEEIDLYLTKTLKREVSKEDLPEPGKLKHIQLNTLDISVAETPNFGQKVVDMIDNYNENIDNSLLTVINMPNKFLTIYEEDDELCFNSHPVKKTNFTHYMKEVKTKLIEKTIVLTHRLTKTFLSQNIDSYSPQEVQGLKHIYYQVANKKPLTSEQCNILSTILKNGLRIFEILHNYDLHTDEQANKRGHLKNFMLIFAQIYDPVNFRDIFEPNMEEFFRNLVKYAKFCADYCLQFVLIEPFCANNNREQPFNKNIVELLIYNLILRLESTSDILDPFREFYGYKQEYFSLLQKLIRFPFRCLSRYSDDSFIRNYFRQIILILIKKAHTSRFCLDYLHLMRTLFKNILFNCNRDTASPLFTEFYAICSKNSHNASPQSSPHSIFINVNVLENFMKLYETGIPELADIVTELIIMLPLKSKHIIHFAKQGYIVKPLLHCLCMMSDYNYTLRTLKTLEIIISHSNTQEINSFLDGVKDKLINRLYQMVNECKTTDLKLEKITNDLSPLSLKLLAKLGAMSRGKELPIQMKPKDHEEKEVKLKELELIYKEVRTSKVFRLSMVDTIEYAIEIFRKILDPFYQSIVFITMDMVEHCFALLKEVLPLTLVKMHPLAQRIISIFCNILSLSSRYLTISQSILTHIRQEVKRIISEESEKITSELMNFGLNDYCKFFIQALVTNLSERVLITREDNFVKEISEEPKRFIWERIKAMLSATSSTNISHQLCEYVIRMLISQVIMLKNPQHIEINSFQNEYNHVLPYKNAALSCLNQLIDSTEPRVLDATKGDIIQAVFIVVTTVPDILNLKIMQHPAVIANKIFDHMLRDPAELLQFLETEEGGRIFGNILENLVSYSDEAHKIAKSFLNRIMNETSLNLVEILYGQMKWDDIMDKTSVETRSQSRFSLDELTDWKELKAKLKIDKKWPIASLAKNLVKISYNVSEEGLKNSPRMIKMLSNTFLTYELLVNIRYESKYYHAFSIIGKGENGEFSISNSTAFDKNFDNVLKLAQSIIEINSNIYGNYTKIIIEQPAVAPMNGIMSGNPAQLPRPQQPTEARNPRDVQRPSGPTPPPAPPHVNPQTGQSFSINPNTFIDDEEYGLNVEDFDMEVKAWSQLISSILKFQKTVLFNDSIFNLSKQLQKNKHDKSPIVEKRIKMIFSMFDLIGRVERTVRQTAYECIKELLSRQDHPKDLIQNDDKLKHILRPVLISLQLEFKKFTPSFLHMFRKILKLLTQCFNITLIQKLVDKLREMDKNKQPENTTSTTKLPQQAAQKYPNFSEITCEVKCIANFLGLFQHLAFAFHTHRSNNYAINTLILIFKYIVSISDFFTPKLGKHTVKIYIKTVLAKVFNTMCEKISGQNIFNDTSEKEIDYGNFLEIIKMDDSYPLREKLTRETSYIEKAFTEFTKNEKTEVAKLNFKKDYLTFLEIVNELAARNNRWLKGMSSFADKLLNQLNYAIQNRGKKFEEREVQEIGQKNEIVLLAKILLQFIKQNKNDIGYLFGLVNLFKLRATFDLHFIKIYLKYELYYNLSPETRRRIFIEYFRMYKEPLNEHETDKILAISQYIIYEFVLIELPMEPEQRTILVKDEEIIRCITETIKHNLNPRLLNTRNPNTFREAIEILQISNLMMKALKNLLSETDRSGMLCVVWGLLRIEDKIIRNYAFVWTSNYISYFDGLGQSKALGLYLILIKALENLGHGDYQIGALIKKALNILIPYWDNKSRQPQPPPQPGAPAPNNANNPGNSWIEMSLRAVHDESYEQTRLVRFWEIVVKNHEIFTKFKESKFETQMVNSMQMLMVANNPSSTNPLVKKIASDMSFIYIEWKFKQVKEKIRNLETTAEKIKVLESTYNERAAQICLNFFIKVALNNCNDKDDKEIMKRSLYLLKKTLIIWPNTKKKFENIKGIINKQKTSNTQGTQSPIRFHYTLLNIINILLLYETDKNLVPQLTTIFKLMQLGQVTPPRFPPTSAPANHTPQPAASNSIFTINNTYLMHLLCVIVKRLLKVAAAFPTEDESVKLITEIHNCIKEGFDYYVLVTNAKSRVGTQQGNIRQPGPKKIEIEVAISFLKIMFDIDHRFADHHLNNIKQVASAHKKVFERGFEPSNKANNTNRIYEPPALTEGTFQEMLNKNLEINVELVRSDTLEQNYEREIIKSYSTRRPQLVILLRILAAKINLINPEDQGNILDIFLTIYEKIPDPELKIEVINILKCLLIGRSAFPEGIVAQRYERIPIIEYDERKIFYMLFEDNKKFNTHFQKRKIKPSDPNYNLTEMLYEEITAKVYFDFLCMYILRIRSVPSEYLAKIKVFILYAIKIADSELVDKIFRVLDEVFYNRNKPGMFLALFEDYKDLSCAEQYLQGDQIMLFFGIYLYKKIQPRCQLQLEAYNLRTSEAEALKFESFYVKLMKLGQDSRNHLEMLIKLLKMSINLAEESNPKLSMIIKDYLLTGNYNDLQGEVLVRIADDYNCLSEVEQFAVNTNIVNWGMISKCCEGSSKEESKLIMDLVWRMNGDQDLICGYRMGLTRAPELQLAMCNLQQRRYLEALKSVQQYQNSQAKRARAQRIINKEGDNFDDPYLSDVLMGGPLNEELPEKLTQVLRYEKQHDKVFMNDIVKQCYKNLNRWETILDNDKSDVDAKINYLFHSGSNKPKLEEIIKDLEKNSNSPEQFGFYYGKSIMHFLEPGSSPNKDLNIALFYSLVEWICYPKSARSKQNEILVKVQCLLELEEAEKIKDQSNNTYTQHKDGLDALTKVVQNVYTNINYWRERMPRKNENLAVWNAILGQRHILYENIKRKNIALYENVISTATNITTTSFSKPEKLFVPYTDIEWNKLKIQHEQRYFGIYSADKADKQYSPQLYLDENFLKEKERFFELFEHQKDHRQALKVLEDPSNYRDEELEKIQKAERLRLKAKLYRQVGSYEQANELYYEAVSQTDQQLLTVWRDWMCMSIEAYNKTSDPNWAYSAISALPYTLRHKTHKTRLLLAPIFTIIKKLKDDLMVQNILEPLVKNHLLPMKALLHWLPQILSLAAHEVSHPEYKAKFNPMLQVLDELSIYAPSTIFFLIKPYIFRREDPFYNVTYEIIFNRMKNSGYYLTTKLEKFSQLVHKIKVDEKISVMTLGEFYQTFTEISVPLVECEVPSKSPFIIQINENLETEILNNKEGKIITLLGSDGKQYQYRLENVKMDKNPMFEEMLNSQCLETFNEYLKIGRESSIRGLALQELRRIYLKEDLVMTRSSKYSLSLMDILDDFMNKQTPYTSSYPESDKTFLKLPKNEINKSINKHMKEIVPDTVLKAYIEGRAYSYDEYISFRRIFSYQYGSILAINYILGVDAELQNYVIELRTGAIPIHGFTLKQNPIKISPFSVRLSRNIKNFVTSTHVNSGILPAMVATAQALANRDLVIRDYFECLYDDLPGGTKDPAALMARVNDLSNNFQKVRKILELADRISAQEDIPYQLKYWF